MGESSTVSSNSSSSVSSHANTMEPAEEDACSDKSIGQDKAGPEFAATAGVPAEEGLHAANSSKRLGQNAQPANALNLLKWADAETLLDIGRIDKAASSLDAMQEAAEGNKPLSDLMLVYLELVKTATPSCYHEGLQLYGRTLAWYSLQRDALDSLAWAVSQTRAQLSSIRRHWEARLSASFSGKQNQLQMSGTVFTAVAQ